jgi:hypothetical protein
MIETNLTLMLPKGIARTTKMKIPEPSFKNGHEVYEGDNVVMSQPLKVEKEAANGHYSIKGKVTVQSCNGDIYLPPVTEDICIKIMVKWLSIEP